MHNWQPLKNIPSKEQCGRCKKIRLIRPKKVLCYDHSDSSAWHGSCTRPLGHKGKHSSVESDGLSSWKEEW